MNLSFFSGFFFGWALHQNQSKIKLELRSPACFETIAAGITPILYIFDLFHVAAVAKLISLYPIVCFYTISIHQDCKNWGRKQ